MPPAILILPLQLQQTFFSQPIHQPTHLSWRNAQCDGQFALRSPSGSALPQHQQFVFAEVELPGQPRQTAPDRPTRDSESKHKLQQSLGFQRIAVGRTSPADR